MNAEHSLQLVNTPDFPEIFMALANAELEAFNLITQNAEINWIYVTPPADFRADGEKTGTYSLGNGEFALNSKGKSSISYADYAVAMVDLIEQGGKKQAIVSVNGQ